MDVHFLNIGRYWLIPQKPAIRAISTRLIHALGSDYSANEVPLEIRKGKTVQDCLNMSAKLPYLRELEELYLRDLSWVRVRIGQQEVLEHSEQSWLTIGDLVLFSSEQPTRNDVNMAVYKLLKERGKI